MGSCDHQHVKQLVHLSRSGNDDDKTYITCIYIVPTISSIVNDQKHYCTYMYTALHCIRVHVC